MATIEIADETFDLLAEAARFVDMMYNRETDDFEEATPDELANAMIWQAAHDVLRKHREQDNLKIVLPADYDDNIPF